MEERLEECHAQKMKRREEHERIEKRNQRGSCGGSFFDSTACKWDQPGACCRRADGKSGRGCKCLHTT